MCSKSDIFACCCSTELTEKVNFRLFTVDQKEPDLEEATGQDHVFTFWRQLTKAQKDELDKDFNELQHEFGLSLELLKDDFIQAQRNEFLRKTSSNITLTRPRVMDWQLKRPPGLEHGANLTQLANVPAKRRQIWQNTGFDLYAKNRVAIVILSGGLDSRLGEDFPKGTLDFGLLSAKSIFQLYAERIDRLQNLVSKKKQREAERQRDKEEEKSPISGRDQKSQVSVRSSARDQTSQLPGRTSAREENSRSTGKDDLKFEVHVPVYVMCNKANISFISTFFEENNFFGLRERDVMFFQQLEYPHVDHNGKLLLIDKHKIAQSPCGNGSLFRSMVEEGMYADMKIRDLNCMYVCSVDNMLAKVGDPTFLGYCQDCLAECGVKCITKISAEESLGSYCSKVMKTYKDLDGDGKRDLVVTVKPAIYEFSEMDEELRNQKVNHDAHNLTFNAGNLSQYAFKLDFVRRVCDKMDRTWHRIHKRLPHIDLKTGKKIAVSDNSDCNGYRMEQWIFDSFHYSTHVAGLVVPRDEYAVIKQRAGPLSPGSAIRAVSLLHQSWISKAGGAFFGDKIASEQHDSKCEVSPLVSYDGENLDGHFLAPLRLPYYLPSKLEDSDTVAVQPIPLERQSMHFVDDQSPVEAIERDREITSARDEQPESTRGYRGERAHRDEKLPPTPPDAYALGGRRNSLRRGSLGMGDAPYSPYRRNSLTMGDAPFSPYRRNSLTMGDSPLRRNSITGRESFIAGRDSLFSPGEPMDDYDYDGENSLSTARTGRSSRRSARHGNTAFAPVVRTSSRDHSGRRSVFGNAEDPSEDQPARHKSIDVLCPNMKDKDHDAERHTKVELYDWEKIEVERERRAGDESARVSILSGWSHLSVGGHIFEEMEHAFGHIIGTTGVPNTGRGTRVYNESKYFWTPGKHHMGVGDSDSDDGAIVQFIGR